MARKFKFFLEKRTFALFSTTMSNPTLQIRGAHLRKARCLFSEPPSLLCFAKCILYLRLYRVVAAAAVVAATAANARGRKRRRQRRATMRLYSTAVSPALKRLLRGGRV